MIGLIVTQIVDFIITITIIIRILSINVVNLKETRDCNGQTKADHDEFRTVMKM